MKSLALAIVALFALSNVSFAEHKPGHKHPKGEKHEKHEKAEKQMKNKKAAGKGTTETHDAGTTETPAAE